MFQMDPFIRRKSLAETWFETASRVAYFGLLIVRTPANGVDRRNVTATFLWL